MAEQATQQQTAAAQAQGAIDLDKLGGIIATAVAGALKPVADSVAALQAQMKPADTAKKEEGKPLSLADVEKLLDNKLGAQQQSQQLAHRRDSFIGERLAKLPKAYQNMLGSDPAKWEDEAKVIAAQHAADFKASGGQIQNTGGENPAGQSPAAAKPDLSKIPAQERIAMGLAKIPVVTGTAQTQEAAKA